MSNPEKKKMVTEEEIIENSDDSDYLWSDEEGEIRELVLGLPALRVSESHNVDESIHKQAAVAAKLIVAAAEEKAGKTGQSSSENPQIKKLGRPRVLLDVVAGACSNDTDSMVEGEQMKKAKKKGSTQLTHPPQGPPKCHICGKGFVSWKAAFGHLRLHKDRGYQGFLPPPTFNAAEEGFGGTVPVSSGARGFGLGTGGLMIDLNVHPMEEEEDIGSGSTQRFDLNRSPPPDKEEENEDKTE